MTAETPATGLTDAERLLTAAVERTTEFVGGVELNAADAAAVTVNVGDVRRILRALAARAQPTPSGDEREALDVAILTAIKAVREAAADERAALHAAGEPLTDYSSGVLDGLDKAWLAGRRAARRPEDNRTATSIEEWWACDDAYEKGLLDAARTVSPAPSGAEAALAEAWNQGHAAGLVNSEQRKRNAPEVGNPYRALAPSAGPDEAAFSCRVCDYTSDEYGDTHTHPGPDTTEGGA